MNQQNIRIFMAVVEHGSIAEAARTLHYTHPRVSEAVRQLESELGVQLLLRGRGIRKVELTPEGQRFIPVAMQWVMADRQIQRYIQDESAPAFRLNAGANLMEYMAPHIIRKMRREIPDIRVQLLGANKAEILAMMDRKNFDAAIWLGKIFAHTQAIWLPFYEEEWCLLCPADTPLPEDCAISPSELDGRHEIRYSRPSVTDTIDFAPWRREHLPGCMSPMTRVENIMAVSCYMDDRRCWSMVPERVARWSVDRYPGTLTIRHLDPAPPAQKGWILTDRTQLDTPVFRCFLRCSDAWLDETPYLKNLLELPEENENLSFVK